MTNLNIRVLPVGQLQTNCYLIWDTNSLEGIILDPGDDTDYITKTIQHEKIIPTKIIATHGHYDHLLAVNELKHIYNIPFYIHKKDEFLVKKIRASAKYFLGFDPGPHPKINNFLIPNNKIKIKDIEFKIIHTPGHTPGSISLYSPKINILFSGDLIFANGMVGRTDFAYCSHSNLLQSIENILKLPKKTIIYSGHGESSTIEKEKHNHKFTTI